MIRVKICGIRSLEEAHWAVAAGADALGFILIPTSKRYVKPQTLRQITARLPPFISKVGVFSGEPPDNVTEIIHQCALDTIQLHGGEAAELYQQVTVPKIKAFAVDPLNFATEYDLETLLAESSQGLIQGILLDSTVQGHSGGTGVSLPWKDTRFQAILTQLKKVGSPVLLAGGLNPENIQEAIRLTQPYGVDVSSGVERNGHKDSELILRFIESVKESKTTKSPQNERSLEL